MHDLVKADGERLVFASASSREVKFWLNDQVDPEDVTGFLCPRAQRIFMPPLTIRLLLLRILWETRSPRQVVVPSVCVALEKARLLRPNRQPSKQRSAQWIWACVNLMFM